MEKQNQKSIQGKHTLGMMEEWSSCRDLYKQHEVLAEESHPGVTEKVKAFEKTACIIRGMFQNINLSFVLINFTTKCIRVIMLRSK